METLINTVAQLQEILKNSDLFITSEIKVEHDVLLAICKQENLRYNTAVRERKAYTIWNLERLIIIINSKS